MHDSKKYVYQLFIFNTVEVNSKKKLVKIEAQYLLGYCEFIMYFMELERPTNQINR